MSSAYFEHDADIGIIGRALTIEQSFEAAAQAVFAIITKLEQVQPMTAVIIEFAESDPEFALVTWLNLLLGKSHELGMVFSHFHIHRQDGRWQGKALGEQWRDDMERGVEVKGATLTMLSVTQIGPIWESRCVVDV